jgi:hypothetical protein
VSEPTNDRSLPFEVVMNHPDGERFYSGAASMLGAQLLATAAEIAARERGDGHTYTARAKAE